MAPYKADAEHLARLGRMDPQLLSPVKHRGAQAQAALQVIRSRELLVKTRTQLINHVRGSVKVAGCRLSGCTPAAFHKKAASQIPVQLQSALAPVLTTIGRLTQRIRSYDRQLEEWNQHSGDPVPAAGGFSFSFRDVFLTTVWERASKPFTVVVTRRGEVQTGGG